jgi:RNase P subunit RPR2
MTTTCQKCSNLLVAEPHLDFYSRLARWKCVNCGWSRTEHQ